MPIEILNVDWKKYSTLGDSKTTFKKLEEGAHLVQRANDIEVVQYISSGVLDRAVERHICAVCSNTDIELPNTVRCRY